MLCYGNYMYYNNINLWYVRFTVISPQKDKSSLIDARGGGGDSAYEGGTDARRKFWIKPLKETELTQAFLTPKRDHVKTQTNENNGQRRLL